MTAPLIVVFGAGVRPDGRASVTLARRTARAAQAAKEWPDALLFCSGGLGDHGPSEASVMARLLTPHVDPARLVLDEASSDTLQTVVAAAAFARANGVDRCLACSDGYHLPRIAMLFHLFGMPAEALPMPRSPHHGWVWWRARLREGAAIPYDLVAGLWARRKLQRRGDAGEVGHDDIGTERA